MKKSSAFASITGATLMAILTTVNAGVQGEYIGAGKGIQESNRPKLAVAFPDYANTPDGMTLDDKNGDIYMASPNFNDTTYPGVILKIDKKNNSSIYYVMPVHPVTKRGCPMGMDIGPDNNLYVADNQYFYDKNHQSRLMRITREKGKPTGCDIAADGLNLANAVLWMDDAVYITDTFFDKPCESGIWRITLDEMKKGVVHLKPTHDPHLIATFTTVPNHRKDVAGADGITRDSKKNIYTGNFGDGVISKITIDEKGKATSKILINDPRLSCADGMFCDLKTDIIYVTDSEKNAIHAFTPEGKWWTFWQNGDTDGSDGLLDQPCEIVIRGNDMYVACFDMPFPGLTNQKYDKWHTLNVIKMKP